MKYYNYLFSLKGYSKLTCNLYLKYAKELKHFNNDYFVLLNKYKNTSNNTKRVIISAIKNYYEFIKDERINELKLPKKDTKIQEYVTYDEYLKIIDFYKSKNTLNNLKTLIMIRLLFETGIRSSELLNIKVCDIKFKQIIINGKNKKQRIIYLSDSLFDLILKKIELDKNIILFNFSYKNLYKKISKIGYKILNKKISPHMFRRGFATYCSLNNIDIFDICMLMGHENINTTKMYIKKEVNPNFFNLFNK